MNKEVLIIDKEVDSPDTNITHNNDIVVNANISAGATIKSSKNIFAKNVLGSQLIAGNDIVVENLVDKFKSNDSVLYASGNITLNNVSNANVAAEKSIKAKNVENSYLYSNDSIAIAGKARSSVVTALRGIIINSELSGGDTSVLESGRSVIMENKISALFTEKKTLLNRLENIKKYLDIVDDSEKKDELKNKLNSIKSETDKISEQIFELADFVKSKASFSIIIKGTLLKGTKIVLKDSELILDKNITSSQFTESDGKIIISEL